MAIIRENKKEYNPEIKLSHSTNLIIQLVAFAAVVYIVLFLKYTWLGNTCTERLFTCSIIMICFTVLQCALCTFKGGYFVLLWIAFFILSLLVKKNEVRIKYKCLVTIESIVDGYSRSSFAGIYVNLCGCPDNKLRVQYPNSFSNMNGLKKGDTLLATINLYPEGILPGGIGRLTLRLKRNFTATEKEEYTKPSYWYYSFFPSCVEDYGCNIVYKVPNINGYLTFTDIRGNKQNIPSGYKSVDTVLVYKNINPDLGKKYEICSQKINTSENLAKISDYGYLFENDIYSKEEVEKECPGVKKYVEKYKERNKQ